MGSKIALTGIVIFIFFAYCCYVWKGSKHGEFAAIISGFGLIAVPIGLLIQIWQ